MNAPVIIATVLAVGIVYCIASLIWVYKFRGALRWDSFGEYVRKGWPLFSPFNCFLYLCTQKRAKPPIMDLSQFKELDALRDNWETIRDEAVALQEQGAFEAIKDPNSKSYYDLGFRTFFKYGWSKFYLRWYGHSLQSAKETCPKTVEIVSKIKCVNGAMFSILPAGSKLTRHLDPVASSMRFHLGLSTPNDDKCWIEIDGQKYSWRDGEALLFDETFLHHARNDADAYRLILMCDVNRPMNILGHVVNKLACLVLSMSLVPNRDGDKRGLVNKTFSTLSPLLARSKALKERNRPLYLLVKWTVNMSLLMLLLAMAGAVVWGLYALVQALQLPDVVPAASAAADS